jgi:excisionase family DNA binding protein
MKYESNCESKYERTKLAMKGITKQNTNDMDIRLVSVPEACDRLSIGSWKMYQQIGVGAIKTVKIGKRRLISTREIADYISAREQ